MDLSPTNITLAPARSTAEPSPSIEHHVGELVAQAAATLAAGLREKSRGKLSLRTKMAGGDLIVELFKLRQMMVADWPFDSIAREHGTAALREACGSEVNAATIDELVEAVMDILRNVVRKAVN